MVDDVTPWWQALALRKEIVNASGQIDDVQMSLYNAVYQPPGVDVPYADAGYYGAITYPTGRLVDLLTEVAIRLGGGDDHTKARAVTRLDQGMGGGKSHACIGAYHLAAHPAALLRTELGAEVKALAADRLGKQLPASLDDPHVVVLACDNMTPGVPDKTLDGPAETLYERFLWRLFDGDYSLYNRYREFYSSKAKIGEALGAIGKPVLVIVDEIVDYIGNGLDGAGKPDLTAQDMAFLRALLDVVNDVPHVAAIVVMIDSEKDSTALSADGDRRRQDLHGLLVRNAVSATVTEVSDFVDILRRRLFEQRPAKEVVAATARLYRDTMADESWAKSVWGALDASWQKNWAGQVADCYPFHPMLINIVRNEWAQVTGFQRVRSTIRIFAATVYALQKRGAAGGWVPPLIGPGDLPLSDNSVREAILYSGLVEDDKTRNNYRSLAENEIVNSARDAGIARSQDDERAADPPMWFLINPQASERAATFIFLASIIGTLRPGRGRGASAPEVKAATSVPDTVYTVTDADLVVSALVDAENGLNAVETIQGHGKGRPPRYFLSTRLTYRMLVNSSKATVTDAERDDTLAEFAKKLANTGPFQELRFVAADPDRSSVDVLTTAGLDNAHSTRLIVLDPAQFSLRNGMEKATVVALKTAMGLDAGDGKTPVQWASSAVFAVVNTQRRGMARGVAKEYLARQRALESSEVQSDEQLKQEGQRELADARKNLERAVRKAYQHVAYLAQPDPDGERGYADLTIDEDNLTALDGAAVWKELAAADKALDSGQLTVTALLHNLREQDYGRTLAEIRDAFYNAPRLPLLYGRDTDLKQAIFDAVGEQRLRIVDGSGEPVTITAPTHVNLSSTGLRLMKPPPKCPVCGVAEDNHECAPAGGGGEKDAGAGDADGGAGDSKDDVSDGTDGKGAAPPPADPDKKIGLTFSASLLDSADAADKYAQLFRNLYLAIDDGSASFLQGTITVVANGGAVDTIVDAAQQLGLDPRVNGV